MSFIKRSAIAGLLAFSILSSSGQVDYTFTGNKDGTNWFDPANWLVEGLPPTQIPRPSDNVTIGPNRLTAVITTNVTVNDLTILNQGALDGPGQITVNGTFEFNSTVANQNPKLSGDAYLIIRGTMNVRGSCNLLRGVNNYGTNAILQNGGSGPGNLHCAPNITYNNYGVITLEDATMITGGASLLSYGRIAKNTGTGAAYLGVSSSNPGPNIFNDSSIAVTSGTLSLYPANNDSCQGEYHTESNGQILLHGEQHFSIGLISGAGICHSDGTIIYSGPSLVVAGTLELDGGQFSAPHGGPLYVRPGGEFIWQAGALDSVACLIDTGASLQISGDMEKHMTSCFITNRGRTEWTGGGNVIDQPDTNNIPSELWNYGQFVAYNDATFGGELQFLLPRFLNLAGASFVKTLYDTNNPAGPGSEVTHVFDFEDQGGTIQVASGTLSIADGTLSNSTLIVNESGVALVLQSGNVAVAGYTRATTTLPGEIRILPLGALTITNNATLEVSGLLRLVGDEIGGSGTLVLSSTTFFFDGGTLAVAHVNSDNGAILTNYVKNAGQGILNCTFNNGGLFAMGGSVSLTGSSFINATGGQFIPSANLDMTGTGSVVQNSGLMQDPPGITIHLTSLQNSGLMNLNGPFYPFSVLNNGTINANGLIAPSSGFTQAVGSVNIGPTGTVMISTFNLNGGLLTGVPGSVLLGNLNNNSTSGVDPPLVNGNYTSTSNGTVTVHLGGLTPVTQYDQFNVIGNAALDGTLNVNLANGFVPTLGNQFRVMTFGSRLGTFAVKNGLKLPNGLYLMPLYSSTNLTLVATNGVFIQPAIQVSRGPGPGGTQLTWPGINGQAYQVQFSPDLIHWYVETNLLGSGLPLSLIDLTTPPAPPVRFYRLR